MIVFSVARFGTLQLEMTKGGEPASYSVVMKSPNHRFIVRASGKASFNVPSGTYEVQVQHGVTLEKQHFTAEVRNGKTVVKTGTFAN